MSILTAIFLTLSLMIMLINNLKIQNLFFHKKYIYNLSTNIILILLFLILTIITSFIGVQNPIPFYYIFLYIIQYISIALIPLILLENGFKSIICTSVFLIFSDSLVCSSLYVIIGIVFKNSYKDLSNSSISFAVQIITFIFILLCEKKNYWMYVRKNIYLLNNSTFILILTILVFLSGLSSSLSANTEYTNIKMLYIQIFTVILIILSLITIIFLLFNSISRKHYEQTSRLLDEKMKSQLKYYILIDEKDTEMRKFRHDFRQHMMCIVSMLEEKSFSDAEKYIRQLTNKFNETIPLYKTGNYIADSILSDKAKECKDKKIDFKFKGIIPEQSLDPLELCTILSNALNNAIEACTEISQVPAYIKIVSDYKNNYWYLKIVNTSFSNIEIHSNIISTTKKDIINHGFGLQNISDVVNKHNGEFKIEKKNNEFIFEITMCLK